MENTLGSGQHGTLVRSCHKHWSRGRDGEREKIPGVFKRGRNRRQHGIGYRWGTVTERKGPTDPQVSGFERTDVVPSLKSRVRNAA